MNIRLSNLNEAMILQLVRERADNVMVQEIIDSRTQRLTNSHLSRGGLVLTSVLVVHDAVLVSQAMVLALAVAKNTSVAIG